MAEKQRPNDLFKKNNNNFIHMKNYNFIYMKNMLIDQINILYDNLYYYAYAVFPVALKRLRNYKMCVWMGL